MIYRVGTDLLKEGHIKKINLMNDDPFLLRIYSLQEIKEAKNRSVPYNYYCDRFAGKEAVFKALGIDCGHVLFREIEILTMNNGEPYVILHGQIKKVAKQKGIRKIHLSLSYDTDCFIAFAVTEN